MPFPLTSRAVNPLRCMLLHWEGTWRFANCSWQSKRMWPRKLACMTPYQGVFVWHFSTIFCFRFLKPSCSAPAPLAFKKLRKVSPPLTSRAVNTPRCIGLQVEGTWRLANFWWKSKRMWPRRISGMTPYHPYLSFFLHFRTIFCFRFLKPSCFASALSPSKLRTFPSPSRPLQSKHCTACCCKGRTLGDLQIFGGSQSECGHEGQVRHFASRASLRLNYHSPAALQGRLDSPQMRHVPQQTRRVRVPAQHRRPGVSAFGPFPHTPLTPLLSLLDLLCILAFQ
jgi:hypothetical protein